MIIVADFSALQKCGGAGAAIALGTFDGLHRGHQAVIKAALDTARSLGAPTAVAIFRRHPFSLIAPQSEPPALVAPAERRRILAAIGIDYLVELAPTPALMALSPDEFARSLQAARPAALIAGENYTFGRKAAGDISRLARCAAAYNLGQVGKVPLLFDGGEPVSSTRIRAAIAAGDMMLASGLLGRDYALAGRVNHGDEQGRKIGFPTANLALPPHYALPPCGAYAALVQIAAEEKYYPAIAAITEKPTAGGVARRLEAHLLDFSGDLYGANIRVYFRKKMRGEKKFASLDELKARLELDKNAARRIL